MRGLLEARCRWVHDGGHDGGDDTGRVLLLVLVYFLISLLLVAAVTAATGVHLERKRLLALADQAALAAAVAVDDPGYYARDGDRLVHLTEPGVRAAAEDHLAVSATGRLAGLRVARTWTDGSSAEVTLEAVAHPPLLGWLTRAWSDGVPLRATSRARASAD